MAIDEATDSVYAVKMFANKAFFDTEAAFYSNIGDSAAQLLPKVVVLENRDGSVSDPEGGPLPPMLVIEGGESLDHWMGRQRPGVMAALAVCFLPPATLLHNLRAYIFVASALLMRRRPTR